MSRFHVNFHYCCLWKWSCISDWQIQPAFVIFIIKTAAHRIQERTAHLSVTSAWLWWLLLWPESLLCLFRCGTILCFHFLICKWRISIVSKSHFFVRVVLWVWELTVNPQDSVWHIENVLMTVVPKSAFPLPQWTAILCPTGISSKDSQYVPAFHGASSPVWFPALYLPTGESHGLLERAEKVPLPLLVELHDSTPFHPAPVLRLNQ